ncbi:hypothetical protein K0B96_12185 [Horticoccus luteus]|uniref:Tetratricopeptide repeat-like domain-containing protein n=1 Tax=Horticoccus luteus TaxID=2862869 RepID=A0A8F9TU53_9BACT|nr:hypothetical protein [Horticoccus luteus]QYM78066.1 hypothetical protein K0B96_12185 [Horticoccus luteus]
MTKPAKSSSVSPAGADPQLVTPAAPSSEEKLHAFWQRHRGTLLGLFVLVALVLVGKGAWEIWQAKQEQSLQQDYAAASTPEQLRAFASAHNGHLLAGVAQLRLADEAYAAGKSADALTGYEKAAPQLEGTILGARAQLGAAMAKLQAGRTADGTAALQQLANDAKQLKGIRAEAIYHLATLASANGSADDVRKYSDQLIALDPTSPWAQRAMMLRATQPAAPSAPAAAAPEAAAPAVKLNVPGTK